MKLLNVIVAAIAAATPLSSIAAQLLVLNKGDSTLAFIDPESGKTSVTIATGDGPHEIELSSDNQLAFVSNYGGSVAGKTLSVIEVDKRAERQRVDLKELRRPHGLSSSKGYLYFTIEDSRSVGRYNSKTGTVDWTFDTKQERTHMILASRDGTKLFTSNMGSNSIGVLERGANNQWHQTLVAVGQGPEGLDESPDGRELWTAHSGDGGISIIDTSTKKVVHTFDIETKRSNRLKFTPDGKHVLVSDLGSGELVIIDVRQRAERTHLSVGRSPTGILIEPEGTRAYVAVSGDNRIAVVDLKTMSVQRTIQTGNNPDGMAWVR